MRWLVHAHTVELRKKTFYHLLDSFPDDLTVNILDINQDTGSSRLYVGECFNKDVQDAMRQHESYVFFDGAHQLSIVRQDTGEFFAFDEHDVFVLYFDPKDHFVWLRDVGYHEGPETMIWDSAHIHLRPPDANSMRDSLISVLGLKPYPYE